MGVPPIRDHWTERAHALLHHLARSLLHDARTVLEVTGLTGSRYSEFDTLLRKLLQIVRLRISELDRNVVQNGSRPWMQSPRLIELGQHWIREEQEGVPLDNRQLNSEDSTDLAGTYHTEN